MEFSTNRRQLLLSGAAFGALSLFGTRAFAQSADAGEPVRGGTLRMWNMEPPALTTAATSSGFSFNLSNKIFDGLIDFDFDFNPVPKLATSWEISDDGLQMKFNLREGVKWHDGTPFTARDVEFSALEAWQKVHPRGRSTWANLERVEVPDDLTVIFHMKKPALYAVAALFGAESQIIPRHIYEGTDIVTNPANAAPIGTGPFKFREWARGQYVHLVRNDEYWDAPRPYLDEIIVQFIPDTSARAIALEAGEIDIAGALPVPLNDAARLAALPYLTIPERGGEGYSQFVFMELNNRREHLSDARVRQAFLHAIDRDFITNQFFFGLAKPATGPIPYTQSKYYTADVPAYPYDLEKAKALLDEAGYRPDASGVRFTMTCDPIPGFNEFINMVATYFQSQLALIGVKVEIRSQDMAGYTKRIYDDYDFDATVVSLTGMSDPTIGIQRLYWGKNIKKGTPFANASGYDNETANKALEAAQIAPNEAVRQQAFYEFQRQVMTDVPTLPIADVSYFTVMNTRVQGFQTTPWGISGNFADVWLKAE